jgi:competence CoiA-like predicted nuclease
MVCCGVKGHIRTSKNGLKHFYHGQKNAECGGEPESLDHLKLKYQIYQICKSEGWWVQPEYQSPSRDWRADVFAVKNERKIVFEIQLSIIDLNELKEREMKYRRDGIESYWILKNFLNIFPNDNSKFVAGSRRGVFIENYLNYGDFCLDREQEFLIQHGIRTIGINVEDCCLYTADILAIDISEWVKSALKGEYKKSLNNFESNYKKKLELREMVTLKLEKLSEFGSRRFEYDKEIKKIYAIFKNNKWEDHPSLQQEIRDMYSTFDTFKKAWGKIFSPKNGFVWKDYMQLGHEEPILNLISENQITSIHNQIINLEDEERKFLSLFNVVKEYVEKKDAEKYDEIIQLFCSNAPEYSDPNHYRNKKLYRQQQYENNQPAEKTVENKPPEIIKNQVISQKNNLMFEFIPVLPTLWIESQRGWKYQNPAGCTWEINEDDAIDFEKKGFGKIIKK